MAKCTLCKKELDEFERELCHSCYPLMRMKYPKIKCLEEQIKCHKRHAKKRRR
jgi:hypothetical protein